MAVFSINKNVVQLFFDKFILKSRPLRKVLQVILLIPLLFVSIAFLFSLFTIRLNKQNPSLLLVDRYQGFIGALENRDSLFGYWPLPDTLPVKIPVLLKAAEDHRFEKHIGVDVRSIGRAVYGNISGRKKISGASTIAMQVARMQGAGTHRSYFFKIREAFTAIWLTLFYGRNRVLRHYLTIAPYGNRICGINYAARRYFKKPLSDLSWAEAALLTALPNAPGAMNLYRHKGFGVSKKRARYILYRAFTLNWMPKEEYEFALKELDQLPLPTKELRQDNMIHPILAVDRYLKENKKELSLDPQNPTLRLTLNSDFQDKVTLVSMKHMDALRKKGASNCAVMILKRETGEILAYSGSDYYFDTFNAGQIDFVNVKRSTGSTLKPFIYAFGMEWNGYTPATLLTDIGLYFGDGTQPFIPRNNDDQYLGPVLYKFALANSRNIPAIQVLRDIGLDRAYRKLADLGLTSDDGNAAYYGLGLAVGNLFCTLHQLCNSYLVLANEGRQIKTHWIYGEKDTNAVQFFEKNTVLQIQSMLSDPQARLPSFPRNSYLEYHYPVAIKTGTSHGYRDAWTIGWSDTYLVGVWVGHHDFQPTKELGGFNAAAPVVQDIFAFLHTDRKEGLNNITFQPPPEYKPFRINTLTGELNSEHAPFSTTVYLKPGTEPVVYSSIERWLSIDKRNGLLASPYCPQKYTVSKRFIALPGIFKDWAQIQKFDLPPQEYSPLCGASAVINDYKISVLYPQNGSRIFIDPEMPKENNIFMLNCIVEPRTSDVLWIVDGKEYSVTKFPYREAWHLTPGTHTFQAQVPYTQCRSEVVKIDVY